MDIKESNEMIGKFLTQLTGTDKDSDAAFDSDWNALMEVIQYILPPNGWSLNGIILQGEIANILGTAKIDLTYERVVNFVKWYNTEYRMLREKI